MFGDEKTIREVSALIEKQKTSSSLQDFYTVLDQWQPFRTYGGKGEKQEGDESAASCLTDFDAESGMEEISPFIKLPIPVLLYIISYLDAKSVCNLSQTHSLYHSLCGDHLLWKELLNKDKLKWNEVGHSSNPSSFMSAYSEMSLKNIYMRCSPDTRKKEKFNFMQIPRLIKSYFPHQSPKVILFGPGLDSDTSIIVRKMLNMIENDTFKNNGPFPAMFSGSVGTGFKISVTDESTVHHMRLSTLYSGTKKSREISPLENRSERSCLLKKVVENGEEHYEPSDNIMELCRSVNAFICVVESSKHLQTVSGCAEELHTLLDHKRTPHTSPLLVLSCTPDHDTPRIPCVTIAEQLHLHKLVRQWKVVDGVVSDLHGISSGIRWLIEAAQGTAS